MNERQKDLLELYEEVYESYVSADKKDWKYANIENAENYLFEELIGEGLTHEAQAIAERLNNKYPLPDQNQDI